MLFKLDRDGIYVIISEVSIFSKQSLFDLLNLVSNPPESGITDKEFNSTLLAIADLVELEFLNGIKRSNVCELFTEDCQQILKAVVDLNFPVRESKEENEKEVKGSSTPWNDVKNETLIALVRQGQAPSLESAISIAKSLSANDLHYVITRITKLREQDLEASPNDYFKSKKGKKQLEEATKKHQEDLKSGGFFGKDPQKFFDAIDANLSGKPQTLDDIT